MTTPIERQVAGHVRAGYRNAIALLNIACTNSGAGVFAYMHDLNATELRMACAALAGAGSVMVEVLAAERDMTASDYLQNAALMFENTAIAGEH